MPLSEREVISVGVSSFFHTLAYIGSVYNTPGYMRAEGRMTIDGLTVRKDQGRNRDGWANTSGE